MSSRAFCSATNAGKSASFDENLAANHGNLSDRRIDDVFSERRVVVEHEAEDRCYEEKRRKQSEEPVVGDEGRRVG
jgi:hypothetical protein